MLEHPSRKRLTAREQRRRMQLRSLVEVALQDLLRFRVSHSLAAFLLDDAKSDWRSLEDRLHQNYPIKAIGIDATRKRLADVDGSNGGFLHADEPLSPDDATDEMGSFPLNAASASFVFTLVEMYGDNVQTLVNPAAVSKRASWHGTLRDAIHPNDRVAIESARKAFAEAFMSKADNLPLKAIVDFLMFKRTRNAFAHQAEHAISFDEYFSIALATVCWIHFLSVPNDRLLRFFPWPDLEGKWGSRTLVASGLPLRPVDLPRTRVRNNEKTTWRR